MSHRHSLLFVALLAACGGLLGAPAHATDALKGPVIPPLDVAPGFPAPEALPAGVLQAAVASYERGDLLAARRELEALIQGKRVWGDERLGARFLLGWISAQMGHHQQASANFYRVRKAEDHPLREFAMYLEARADMHRGHQRTAIKECEAYLEAYEEGAWADECRLVVAQSNMELGHLKVAIEQYEEFLDAHPDDQRKEAISLRVARALEQLGFAESAGRRYRVLYLDHKLPTTGQEADAALRRLEASGAPLPPITDEDLYIRACSLRRSGAHDASYDLFCALDERNDGDGEKATPLGARLDRERHDFLWRIERELPQPGFIGVFDRSHYEEVLIHRVRGLSTPDAIQERYGRIVEFEREIAERGIALVKVMLHVSREEQGTRLLERLDRPDKHWKFNPGDIDERQRWDDYMEAYQVAINRTARASAPWHVVPADRKWFARLAVHELLVEALERIDPQWPVADFDVAAERERLLATGDVVVVEADVADDADADAGGGGVEGQDALDGQGEQDKDDAKRTKAKNDKKDKQDKQDDKSKKAKKDKKRKKGKKGKDTKAGKQSGEQAGAKGDHQAAM